MPAPSEASSSLKWIHCKFSMQLSPAHLADVRAGIGEQLGNSMLRYNTSLGGVALMFDRLAIKSDLAVISSDAPVVFVPIEVRLLVFAPEVGQRMEATVLRHGSDHLALLAHGLVNVTIPHRTAAADAAAGDAPAGGSGEDGGGGGGGGGGGRSNGFADGAMPAVGESVPFDVRALHVSDGLLTVLGELS
ncbi:hypothetical protein EMIHUDRAFT_434044 [Emiliania huxleyi CCMP1516]|uniref:RPA43 OB domain-containing protein n=2 Tax=Emiliania huxleyi TaxID=2903 RepID=A0A0D3KBJ6_EMIH1|nr:hypothetical protein EMIHUDRAFT_434044 [Emiliania huxleyi CCMP1516]EOD33131.1 hypothetical protein EMIHUDRAFT_434044 [Emiliania huxleyi CCMP1516]|eukprot:XP_005785560.1 hypothetical protein EMIHUDRAFT_434044 [Emiliania huxleyi CCMP1516]